MSNILAQLLKKPAKQPVDGFTMLQLANHHKETNWLPKSVMTIIHQEYKREVITKVKHTFKYSHAYFLFTHIERIQYGFKYNCEGMSAKFKNATKAEIKKYYEYCQYIEEQLIKADMQLEAMLLADANEQFE